MIQDLVGVQRSTGRASPESLPASASPASTLVRLSSEPRATTRLFMVASLPASLRMVLKWSTLRPQFCKET